MYDPAFMVEVESSQLAAIGYDKGTGQAYVRFASKRGGTGALYEYDSVPESVVQQIIDAPSAGTQFGATLRYGYAYRRLE